MLPINEKYFIYQLLFPNQKSYIGKSINPKGRFLSHKRDALNKSNLVYRAWRKHGEPKLIILGATSPIFINSFEKYWINKLSTFGAGYNMTFGGDGGITYTWSESQKLAQSERMLHKPSHSKGCSWSQEAKDKLSKSVSGSNNSFYGKTHSSTQKEKWSLMRKGVTPWNKDIPQTQKAKDKIRKTLLSKPPKSCPFCCLKMASSNFGRHKAKCQLAPHGKLVGVSEFITARSNYDKCECGEWFTAGRGLNYHKNKCKDKKC